jgi:hypothetical protein
LELKNFFPQDPQGNVIPGATVYLYLPGTTTLATGLQNADGTPLANPFTADVTGKAAVAAPDGDYDLRMVGAGRDSTMRVRFLDASEGGVLAFRQDIASTAVGKGAALVGLSSGLTVDYKLSPNLFVEDFGGRVLVGSESANKIVLVDADNEMKTHWNSSGETVIFDISTINFGKLYAFVNSSTSRTILDPGPAGVITGYGSVGNQLQFNGGEGCIVVRASGGVYMLVAKHERFGSGAAGSTQRYWQLPDGRWQLEGFASVSAQSDAIVNLPAMFGGSASFRVVATWQRNSSANGTFSPVWLKRLSNSPGVAGVTGPSFTINNPNTVNGEFAFIVSNLEAQ